jgi:hypothetical protein
MMDMQSEAAEEWACIGPPENIHVVNAAQPHLRICFLTSDGPTVKRGHLIAASPALLSGAKALRAAQRAYMASRGNEALGKAVGDAAESLDAAIAKAEGR